MTKSDRGTVGVFAAEGLAGGTSELEVHPTKRRASAGAKRWSCGLSIVTEALLRQMWSLIFRRRRTASR
jgi:hypothetical protein